LPRSIRHGNRSEEANSFCSFRGEVRECGRGGTPAYLLQRDPVQPEVDAFYTHVGTESDESIA
jgi:hypothetical protein